MCGNSEVFNVEDKTFWYLSKKKVNFPYILYFCMLHAMSRPQKKRVLKMQKQFLSNPNIFGTKLFVTFLIRKNIPHLMV